MNIIDPHLHFFNRTEGEYHWLLPENPPYWPDKAELDAPALPHLLPHDGAVNVAGFVHVEAGYDNARPWREIHWLNRVCHQPFKAVASIDLTGNDFQPQLSALRQMKAVSGVRHILDEAAADILSRPVVRHRLKQLGHAELSFDAQLNLGDSDAVKQLMRLLDEAPHLNVIINHGGLSATGPDNYRQWLCGVQALSAYPNVALKLSGWEMLQRRWQWSFVHTVLEDVLSEFAPSQVMFASNYPLCRWRIPYRQLWLGYRRVLPDALQPALLHDNACRWYGLAAGKPA